MILFEAPVQVKLKVSLPNPVALNVQTGSEEVKLEVNELVEYVPLIVETNIKINGDEYEGGYTVTPHAHDAQVLATKDKVCTENVTVLKVPKYETSNLAGGVTVYIAEV